MPSAMPANMSGAVSGVIPAAGWGAARAALQAHWPEYLIEMAGLGVFMIAAGLCVMLISAAGRERRAEPRSAACADRGRDGADSHRADLFAVPARQRRSALAGA